MSIKSGRRCVWHSFRACRSCCCCARSGYSAAWSVLDASVALSELCCVPTLGSLAGCVRTLVCIVNRDSFCIVSLHWRVSFCCSCVSIHRLPALCVCSLCSPSHRVFHHCRTGTYCEGEPRRTSQTNVTGLKLCRCMHGAGVRATALFHVLDSAKKGAP